MKNNIIITLLVFVVVYLVGSLDNKNGGKIYIDNKDLDNFNQKELSLYRSSYCGFIF